MHDVDLIPASYRRERLRLLWLKGIGMLVLVLIMTTAGARVWIDTAIERTNAEVSRLQTQQTITSRERNELEALTQARQSYLEQLYLLKGLRSGAATTELFRIIDQAFIGDELWFRSWEFRRAGVTNARGQSIETGYFVMVENDDEQDEQWRVETHMAISGQATNHAAISEFVQRLLGHREIDSAHVRRTELQRYTNRSLVEFELAVVINREATP